MILSAPLQKILILSFYHYDPAHFECIKIIKNTGNDDFKFSARKKKIKVCNLEIFLLIKNYLLRKILHSRVPVNWGDVTLVSTRPLGDFRIT